MTRIEPEEFRIVGNEYPVLPYEPPQALQVKKGGKTLLGLLLVAGAVGLGALASRAGFRHWVASVATASAKAKESPRALPDWKPTVDKLNKDLDTIRKDLEKVKGELRDSQARLDAERKVSGGLAARKAELENRVGGLQAEVTTTKGDLALAVKAAEQAVAVRAAFQDANDNTRRLIANLESQLTTRAVERDKALDEVARLGDAVDVLKKAVAASMSREVSALNSRAEAEAELKKQRQRVSDLVRDNAARHQSPQVQVQVQGVYPYYYYWYYPYKPG